MKPPRRAKRAQPDPEPGRCTATTRAGQRCKLPALDGGKCVVHRPPSPGKAA